MLYFDTGGGMWNDITVAQATQDPTTLEISFIRNVLPPGAPLAMHQQSSCLVDAYKRTDRITSYNVCYTKLLRRVLLQTKEAIDQRLRMRFNLCMKQA